MTDTATPMPASAAAGTTTRRRVKDETPTMAKLAKATATGPGKYIVWLIAALWTVPTIGLLISSFRPEDDIKKTGWWTWFTEPGNVTTENYSKVLEFDIGGQPFSSFFWNTVQIAIPGAIIPIAVASFAAYALSWMKFAGRDALSVFIVALMVVPLQMCLIPLLRLFSSDFFPSALDGVPSIWLAHAIFGMPIAIFLLKNFIGALPSEVIEAARVDGASHMTIFVRIVMPLSVPAIASLAIFQFLWVWNDYLVAKVFGGGVKNQPMTKALVDMVGNKGNEWQLLTAGAFVAMIVPLIVFLSLQRYFVRGLLAGSVKG
jgi:alpha-glucoside transport system permease protein